MINNLFRSKFTFMLSTTSSNGIILISENEKTTNFDYEILYLEGGKIKYTFNAGSGPSQIESQSTVNDGEWHAITTIRKARNGKLTVDGVTVSGRSPGGLSSMNSIVALYAGGAPANLPTLQKLPVSVLNHHNHDQSSISQSINQSRITIFSTIINRFQYHDNHHHRNHRHHNHQ